MNNQSFVGLWWLPASPDVRLHGTLSFNPAEGNSLTLTGAFHDLRHFFASTQDQIILGESVDGKAVTLFRSLPTHFTSPSGGIPTTGYRATFALIGHHFQDPDSIAFHQYRVRYSFLEQWAAQGVYQLGHEDAEADRPERHIISYTPPADVACEVAGFVITLTSQVSIAGGWATQPSITHRNIFKIRSEKPLSLLDFLHSTNVLLQNFLALAIGRATRPIEIIGRRDDILDQIDNDHFEQRDITILQKVANLPSEESTILPNQMLFTFSEIAAQFENTLRQWFSREAILRPVYNLYFATVNSNALYAEDEFLSLIYAVETYHRRTRQGKYLAEPAIDEVRQALTNAIPPSVPDDLRTSLIQKLKYINEFSLRRRIKEVLNLLPNVFSIFIEDFDAFIDVIVNTRNYFTHHDATLETRSLKGKELYAATHKLDAIVQICFLLELGFSEESMTKIVQNRQPFSGLRGR
jgi:hypothetical protein